MIGYFLTHLLGMSSSFTNPILYAFYNDVFYKEIKQLLSFNSKREVIGNNIKKTIFGSPVDKSQAKK